LARSKCTQIVKNVIARQEVEEIVTLKTNKFSILLDESTDISDTPDSQTCKGTTETRCDFQ